VFPTAALPDSASSAEDLLLNQFRSHLSDEFLVFHSVKWLSRQRQSHDDDGEMDFLIAHQSYGLLVLEVKGGRIHVDDQSGQWYSIDRHEVEHEIRNPFDQARRNLYALDKKLKDSPLTRQYRFRLQRGVAFPDVIVTESIGLYGEREHILDASDLNDIGAAVTRLFGGPSDGNLPARALKNLTELVAPRREITRIGLSADFRRSEEQLVHLTERQFELLNFLQNRPRAAIAGCAGSGKTLLALEKVRRLSRDGFRTLFTCFNKNLGSWASDLLQRDTYVPSNRVYVRHFHGLAADVCRDAGIPLFPSGEKANFEKVPDRMLEALTRHPQDFDAIVVDEGQDFDEVWWVPLTEMLKDPAEGVLYVFYDANQRIYDRSMNLPVEGAPFVLDLNCRNTTQIHEVVLRYFSGNPTPRSLGPDGQPVKYVDVSKHGPTEAMRKILHDLISVEGLPSHAIVVLTPFSEATSSLKEATTLGAYTLTWGQPGRDQIAVRSIYSFKGLESPVVILAELSELSTRKEESLRDTSDYLTYVGLSRARHSLIILGDLPEPIAQQGGNHG